MKVTNATICVMVRENFSIKMVGCMTETGSAIK